MKDRTKEISARRIAAWELASVDGVMEPPEEWASSYSNDEMEEANASGMAASDGLLLGRMTYEHLAAFWPLVRSLLRDGLLDELGLMVHPVVMGCGKRLFENGDDRKGAACGLTARILKLREASRVLAAGYLVGGRRRDG